MHWYSHSRGNPIYWTGWDWRYITGELHDDTRRCSECMIAHEPYGPDACIGKLDGEFISVCCGHGMTERSIFLTRGLLKA